MNQDARKVLLDIRRPEDVELARVLIDTARGDMSFYLLFSEPELLDRFSPITHEHGLDAAACILHADAFCALIGFGAPTAQAERAELLLVSLFNELGINTVKIQRALLEAGFPPLASAVREAGSTALAERYGQKRLISWSGDDGIGYPTSELVRSNVTAREDLVLVTSNFDWGGYTDKECHQFAIAVVKLAMKHPETTFVYMPRAEEIRHVRGSAMVNMLEAYELGNLRVETKEPLADVMARAGAAITMMSTSVLDLGLLNKPFLMFSSPSTDPLYERSSERGFANYFELEARFSHRDEKPGLYRPVTDVPRLDHERLRAHLLEASKSAPLADDWKSTAMRYYVAYREGEAVNARIAELESNVSKVLGRVTKLEKSASNVERTVSKLPDRVSRVLERIGVLQRSTLAYKARRLLARAQQDTGPKRRA